MLFCRTIEYAQKIIQNHAGIFQINAACFDHVKNLVQPHLIRCAILQRGSKAFSVSSGSPISTDCVCSSGLRSTQVSS